MTSWMRCLRLHKCRPIWKVSHRNAKQHFKNDTEAGLKKLAYSERAEAGEYSEAEQAAEEERLAEMQEEVTNMQQNLEREIQQRQAELFNPLLIKVEEAMAEVAEEMGLDFVLNKTSNTGDPIVYYASERATDITQQVIEKLN